MRISDWSSDVCSSDLAPEDPVLIDIAAALNSSQAANGAWLAGVMTHAGASYDCQSTADIAAMAEQERAGAVRAAQRLRAAGFAAPVVSVGDRKSTRLNSSH